MSQTIRINKMAFILSFASLSFCCFSELFSQHVKKDASGKKIVQLVNGGNALGKTSSVDPPPQIPNWPRPLPISYSDGNACARMVDLNEDGDLEVVAGFDNRIYAWDFTGTLLPGWENGILLNGGMTSVAATADIDGDQKKEIFVSTEWHTIYAFKLDGTSLTGWPITVSGGQNSPYVSVSLCDLDGDGSLEVIVPARSQIHVRRLDGTAYPGWPFTTNPSGVWGYGDIVATAAAGDLQGNGSAPEIIVVAWAWAVNEFRVYALNNSGTLLSGWPKVIPNEGSSYSTPTLADLDGNGDLEILVTTYFENPDGSHIYAFNHDGTIVSGFPVQWESSQTYAQAVVGDIDDDGYLEIFSGTHYGGIPAVPNFHGWHHDGSEIQNWPVPVEGIVDPSALLFDIDGDRNIEVLTVGAPGLGFYAFEFNGNLVTGFPFNDPGNVAEIGSPSVWDVDGDGDFELSFTNSGNYSDITGQFTGAHVSLWDFNAPFYSDKIEWGTMHHDNHNTNLYEQPVTGSLQQNTTWWGRIKVRNTVTVPAGKALNIQGGTTVRFASGAVLNVDGQIKVTGTLYEPVVFDSNSNVTFASGSTVTVNPGVTITVEGTLTIASGATITGGGSIVTSGSGKIFVTNSAAALASNNSRKLARDSNGNYHLVFETDGEVCYEKLINGGAAIGEFRRLSNGVADGVKSNPAICVRDNNVFVVWQKNTGSSHDITFHKSTNGGATWPGGNRKVLATNVGANPPLPVIVSSATNQIMVVYRTNSNLSYLTSSDDGNTWSAVTAVPSTGIHAAHQSMAVTNTYWGQQHTQCYGQHQYQWQRHDILSLS